MKGTFPLYTEAIKFYDSKESMVRVAVKTLTLNVYRGWFSLVPWGGSNRMDSPRPAHAQVRYGQDGGSLLQ
jgi:hypothetical protein